MHCTLIPLKMQALACVNIMWIWTQQWKGRVIDRLLSFPQGQGCMHCCIKWLAAVRLRSIWNPLTLGVIIYQPSETPNEGHISTSAASMLQVAYLCVSQFYGSSKGVWYYWSFKTHIKTCRDVSAEQSKLTPTVAAHSNRFQHGRWAHCISLHDFQCKSVDEVSSAAQMLFFWFNVYIFNHCLTTDGRQQEQPQKVGLTP